MGVPGKRDPSSHRTPAQVRALDSGYNHTPEQIKKRAERNTARQTLMKKGKVHKGDGKDVDHKKPLRSGGSNSPSNWRVIPQHQNRGWERKGK